MAGRPKLDPKDARTKRVTVNLSPVEHKALAALAKKAGVSVSEYVRRMIKRTPQ